MVNTWVTWIADKVIARLAPLIRGERPGIGWLSSRANYRCVCIRTEKQFHSRALIPNLCSTCLWKRSFGKEPTSILLTLLNTPKKQSDDGNPCVLALNTISSTIRWPHAAMTDQMIHQWNTKEIFVMPPENVLKILTCLYIATGTNGKALRFCCRYLDPFLIFVIGH